MTFTFGTLPPAPAELAAAAANAAKIPSRSVFADPGDTAPDFVTLFAAPAHTGPVLAGQCAARGQGDCPGCEQTLTPRLAWLLHTGAETTVDLWTDWASLDQDNLEELLGHAIPPVALRYALRTPGWLGQLAGAVRDIGLMLEAGQVPQPNSTAQEMALHLAIDAATAYLDALWEDTGHPDLDVLNALPVHSPSRVPAIDLDAALQDGLDTLPSVLCEGHDVLMLFDFELDGIEDDEALGEKMRVGNLHPRDWFLPFRELRTAN